MQRSLLLLFLSFFFSISLIAQGLQLPPNKNKIELVYRNVNITKHSQNGPTYSYTKAIPQVKINDAYPVDFKSELLKPYFEACPKARRQLKLFNKETKKAKRSFWNGVYIGGGALLSGFLVNLQMLSNGKDTYIPSALGLGLGTGSMIYGWIKSKKHHKKADKHMEKSIAFYNKSCYVQPIVEAIPPNTSTDNIPANKPITQNDGIKHNYKDTVYYDLLQNEPEKLRLLTGGINFLDVALSAAHEFTYRAGLHLEYQSAPFYAYANYKTALVDNLSGTSEGGRNDSGQVPLIEPTDYQKAHEWNLLAGIQVYGKNEKSKEEIRLGRELVSGLPVDKYTEVDANTYISWSARAGIMSHRSVQYDESGLLLSSSETPKTEVINSFTGENRTFAFDQLDHGMLMLQSTNLSIGISKRVIRDLKVSILNTPLKGKRKSTYISEWYADLLYATQLELGDINYKHRILNPMNDPNMTQSVDYQLQADLTPLKRVGWRAGYRFIDQKGLNYGIELGQRPGIEDYQFFLTTSVLYNFGKRL